MADAEPKPDRSDASSEPRARELQSEMGDVNVGQTHGAAAVLAEQARLLDLSNDAIVVRDVDDRIIYWNRAATEIFGWTRAEALGKDYHGLLKTDAELPLPLMIAKLREMDQLTGEVTQTTRDGRKVQMLCRWALDRDSEGKRGAILTTQTNLTEWKRATAAHRQNEEQFRLMVESVRGFAIFMLDEQGNVVTWNASAERMFGWTEAEMIGRSSAIIFTPEDRAAGAFEGELTTARTTGRALDERWHMKKNGERFWANGTMSLVRGERGEPRGLVKILRDETARKQAEDLLQAAKQTADNANQIKDDFLAMLSHELRTPLSAILLWAKTLRESARRGAGIAEGLDSIISSAHSQARLIDDLLDQSRITTGKLRLELADIDLVETIRAAVEAIEPASDAKSVQIATEFDKNVGTVVADRERIHQILWNLLTNAMKFTPSGGQITVSAKRVVGNVEISVADTGVGIDPVFLPQVFDRFRQFEGSLARTHGGLGLGLTITKQLVEMHGGTISAHSEGKDKGATFTVRLPCPPQGRRRRLGKKQAGAVAPDANEQLQGVSVLFVEDDRDTRTAIVTILKRAGAKVIAVDNVKDAIDAFNNSRPDLILSDISMPDADGYKLLQSIRMIEAKRKADPVPAVALTAYARPEDRQKAIDAGYVVHLGKPIQPAKLLKALALLAQMP